MREELIGIDPERGELRFRHAHANQWGHNITMPMVVGGDRELVARVETLGGEGSIQDR